MPRRLLSNRRLLPLQLLLWRVIARDCEIARLSTARFAQATI